LIYLLMGLHGEKCNTPARRIQSNPALPGFLNASSSSVLSSQSVSCPPTLHAPRAYSHRYTYTAKATATAPTPAANPHRRLRFRAARANVAVMTAACAASMPKKNRSLRRW
jgi:hypothetical protein